MAKTTAPLLGFGASGQIGKTMVYAAWKGVSYARRHVIPANPNTTGQQETRGVFKYLMAVWKQASSLFQAPWTAAAKGQPLTPRNALAKFNIPALRGMSDNTAFIGSPGANGGLSPVSASSSVSTDTLTVTVTPPTLPTDWVIASTVAVALPKEDPETATDYSSFAAEDATSGHAPAISGLTAGDYVWSAWLVFTKPDGTTAYGPSKQGTATIA